LIVDCLRFQGFPYTTINGFNHFATAFRSWQAI
jgi:hypothetical protein